MRISEPQDIKKATPASGSRFSKTNHKAGIKRDYCFRIICEVTVLSPFIMAQ